MNRDLVIIILLILAGIVLAFACLGRECCGKARSQPTRPILSFPASVAPSASRSTHLTGDVSAVSEANGTTVPVSLDVRSSLSIQPSEGSRSRVRRTRGAMGIQSISA